MMRVLFSGGCHIFGYPVGDSLGFFRILERLIETEELNVELRRTGLRNLKHGGSIGRECANSECDLLVLQIGNYETSNGFRKHFGLGKGKSRLSSSSSGGSQASPFGSKLSTLAWQFRSRAKWALDVLLGHPLVETEVHRRQLLAFFEDLRKEWQGEVLVIGPTPCADKTTHYYRRMVLPVYGESCSRLKIAFVDPLEAFHEPSESGPTFRDYHDGLHLSQEGHTRLAHLIWPYLHRRLSVQNSSGEDGYGVSVAGDR